MSFIAKRHQWLGTTCGLNSFLIRSLSSNFYVLKCPVNRICLVSNVYLRWFSAWLSVITGPGRNYKYFQECSSTGRHLSLLLLFNCPLNPQIIQYRGLARLWHRNIRICLFVGMSPLCASTGTPLGFPILPGHLDQTWPLGSVQVGDIAKINVHRII